MSQSKRKPKMSLPPPPGFDKDFVLPDPPAFGWIGDTDHLTLDELDEIHMVAGKPLGELRIQLMGYAAVAYARRVDPGKYPWSIARCIPYKSLRADLDDDGQEEEQLLEETAAAIEAGEAPPDPV